MYSYTDFYVYFIIYLFFLYLKKIVDTKIIIQTKANVLGVHIGQIFIYDQETLFEQE